LSFPKTRLLPAIEVVSRANSIKKTARWGPENAGGFQAMLDWPAVRGIPAYVVLCTAGKLREEVEVTVSDMRPNIASAKEEFEGMDSKEAEKLLLRLLEERYGGRSADDPEPDFDRGADDVIPTGRKEEEVVADSGGDGQPAARIPPADYSVPAVEQAREKLAIVTNWAERLQTIADEDHDGALAIVEDGKRLARLWRKHENTAEAAVGLAARVAVGELVARLKRFQ
jgi:hypothetical protein